MGIISWIIFGLIAGLIAKLLMPGRDPGGFIITILLGIAGAVVGGFIATQFGYGGVDGFNFGSFIVAVLGAIILLIGYRMLRRQ
ncbi:MAG: GlsB/YeaQ/YmgE family stress response membrane protein [Defluviicoccus sp.]|nr:MAG: GlsB/YeaQ/YmgE family stress response membrane protein [Defluviicoccus sp.]